MNITIRDSQESDLAAIFDIRNDPLVAPHQYRIDHSDSPEMWRQMMFGKSDEAVPYFRSTTVLENQKIVGHVTRLHLQVGDQAVCQCGWNLTPACWGRGVMRRALSLLFDDFFNVQNLQYVVADCFSDNHRCIRLLEKLDFQPGKLDFWNRARIAFGTGCWRRVNRYQLSAEAWKSGHGHARTTFDSDCD